MTKLFLILVLALSLVQVPFIFSLDCKSISLENQNLCNSILKMTNLTNDEKILLITNLDYKDNLYPNHFLVYSHNINLNITSSPEGIQTINKVFIKNAWSSIFSLMPSVIYNNSLYSPSESEVLTGFNYNLEIPKDYSSGGYPSTNSGDCKRIYSILQNSSKNNIYVNNLFYGEGRKVRINLKNDSKIISNYSIFLKLKIDHYSWKSSCCKRRYGVCVKTCYSCNFKNSETKEESISIINQKYVKQYQNNLFADLTDLKQDKNSNEVKLNYSDAVLINFKSSSFESYKYLFNLNSSFYPYNVYTIIAKDQNQVKLNNLIYANNILNVKDIANCTISSFDFFNNINSACNLVNNKINLTLKINNPFYSLGEKINVSIFPEDVLVNVSYGNFTVITKKNIIFIANKEYNKIIASYNGEVSEKTIFVFDDSKFILIFNIFLLAVLIFLCYKIVNKYWRFR